MIREAAQLIFDINSIKEKNKTKQEQSGNPVSIEKGMKVFVKRIRDA